jgi:drug/metabolite transporter (DMT)-like permease
MTQLAGAQRGIAIMALTMLVFAVQDGVSKYLGERYSPFFIAMIRYWFFALFVIALSARRAGGLKAVARTRRPGLQWARGALLALEIVVMITSFAALGLVGTHAIFASYSLMVAALAGPVLGETVGWRRWTAIAVGFIGVLIVLRPGLGVFDPMALAALLGAAMFAVYNLLTRLANREDRAATSFFYTGIAGAVTMTLIGPFFWTPMVGWDWGWMAALCLTGMIGHYMLIKALEATEATVIQPFTYLQLVFAVMMGVIVFGETLDAPTVLGAALIVAAGLFTLWRERRSARAAQRVSASSTADRPSR